MLRHSFPPSPQPPSRPCSAFGPNAHFLYLHPACFRCAPCISFGPPVHAAEAKARGIRHAYAPLSTQLVLSPPVPAHISQEASLALHPGARTFLELSALSLRPRLLFE